MHGKPNEQFSLNTGGYSPNIIVNSSNICFAYFFFIFNHKTKQDKTGSRVDTCSSADHFAYTHEHNIMSH